MRIHYFVKSISSFSFALLVLVLEFAIDHSNIKISEHFGLNQLKVGTEEPEDPGEAVEFLTEGEACVKRAV